MPYVLTRQNPKKKKIDILKFLDGFVSLDMLQPPKSYQTTGTKTYYYNYISQDKLAELDIPKQIDVLEYFYEKNKHLDKCNNDKDYDYELQLDLIRKYKQGNDEARAKQLAKEELSKMGLKYFDLYNTFWVPKRSSEPGKTKWRRIDEPNFELKTCLTNLKEMFEVLMDGCYYHTSAFAYIHKRSTKNAVEKHANNKSNWFLKLDFSNFFGNTTPDFVFKMFSEVYPFSEIVKNKRGEDALKNCLNLCFLNGGLPQGTPVSPIITNIMMIPIDHNLSNKLSKKYAISPEGNKSNFVYTRYADDIMVSNKFTFDKDEVISMINNLLDYYEAPFSLNPKKTRYGSNAGQNWILGLMLNQEGDITVGYKRKKILKATISNYMLDRKNSNPWSLEDIQHLQGEIAYCESVEPEKIKYIITEYSKKYGDIKAAIKADLKRLS